MNYLAHIYLSGEDHEVLIGNFIADAVKGSDWQRYSKGIQDGIHLHRSIDHFTDTHEIVKASKSKLWERYRHYNAVIVDIFYDHFLARNWDTYHETPLNDYVKSTYNLLEENKHIFPERIQYLLHYMVKHNWLFNYRSIEGVQSVMNGMSRRTSFNSGMENSTEELLLYYDEFGNEFETFFPLLKEFSTSMVASFE
ncbi:MAG: DUF479 domain-containing protein [Cyclobacteriaceae bacterium]|nr:DUF479 domain-containing protein [Cyclobacteriaceae bacterium]